jgi:hypothetical protein
MLHLVSTSLQLEGCFPELFSGLDGLTRGSDEITILSSEFRDERAALFTFSRHLLHLSLRLFDLTKEDFFLSPERERETDGVRDAEEDGEEDLIAMFPRF